MTAAKPSPSHECKLAEVDKLVLIDLPDVDYKRAEHRDYLLNLIREHSTAPITIVNFECNGVNVTKDLLLHPGVPEELAKLCPTVEQFGLEEFTAFSDLLNFYRIEDDASFCDQNLYELNQALLTFACSLEGECRIRSLLVDEHVAGALRLFPYLENVRTKHITPLAKHFLDGHSKAISLKSLSFKYDAKQQPDLTQLAKLIGASTELITLQLNLCEVTKINDEFDKVMAPATLENFSVECPSTVLPKLGALRKLVKVLIVDTITQVSSDDA